MSAVRPGTLGATRICPHCKANVLVSASVCPGCQHHLRFNRAEPLRTPGYSALAIDATVRHGNPEQACEYCVVLSVADAAGVAIARQVINVGALAPGDSRKFKLDVELIPARGPLAVPGQR
jgi:hypothetical protein